MYIDLNVAMRLLPCIYMYIITMLLSTLKYKATKNNQLKEFETQWKFWSLLVEDPGQEINDFKRIY